MSGTHRNVALQGNRQAVATATHAALTARAVPPPGEEDNDSYESIHSSDINSDASSEDDTDDDNDDDEEFVPWGEDKGSEESDFEAGEVEAERAAADRDSLFGSDTEDDEAAFVGGGQTVSNADLVRYEVSNVQRLDLLRLAKLKGNVGAERVAALAAANRRWHAYEADPTVLAAAEASRRATETAVMAEQEFAAAHEAPATPPNTWPVRVVPLSARLHPVPDHLTAPAPLPRKERLQTRTPAALGVVRDPPAAAASAACTCGHEGYNAQFASSWLLPLAVDEQDMRAAVQNTVEDMWASFRPVFAVHHPHGAHVDKDELPPRVMEVVVHKAMERLQELITLTLLMHNYCGNGDKDAHGLHNDSKVASRAAERCKAFFPSRRRWKPVPADVLTRQEQRESKRLAKMRAQTEFFRRKKAQYKQDKINRALALTNARVLQAANEAAEQAVGQDGGQQGGQGHAAARTGMAEDEQAVANARVSLAAIAAIQAAADRALEDERAAVLRQRMEIVLPELDDGSMAPPDATTVSTGAGEPTGGAAVAGDAPLGRTWASVSVGSAAAAAAPAGCASSSVYTGGVAAAATPTGYASPYLRTDHAASAAATGRASGSVPTVHAATATSSGRVSQSVRAASTAAAATPRGRTSQSVSGARAAAATPSSRTSANVRASHAAAATRTECASPAVPTAASSARTAAAAGCASPAVPTAASSARTAAAACCASPAVPTAASSARTAAATLTSRASPAVPTAASSGPTAAGPTAAATPTGRASPYVPVSLDYAGGDSSASGPTTVVVGSEDLAGHARAAGGGNRTITPPVPLDAGSAAAALASPAVPTSSFASGTTHDSVSAVSAPGASACAAPLPAATVDYSGLAALAEAMEAMVGRIDVERQDVAGPLLENGMRLRHARRSVFGAPKAKRSKGQDDE